MNLPSDTPKLPKWIFLIAAAALLATACFLHDGSKNPDTGLALVIMACVDAAAIVGVIPFVADYARRQDEALDNRQRSLQALSVTVASAAEQIAIAATGLQGIAEAAQENLGKSEKVSEQIQEKMVELRALLASAKKDDGEAAAKLEAVAKKVARATAELEAAAPRISEAVRAVPPPARPRVPESVPELPPVPPDKMIEIRPAAASSDSPFDNPPVSTAAVPAIEPAPAGPTEAAAAPPPPRKRSPRRVAPAAGAAAPDLVLEAQPIPEAAPSISAPEIAEPAVSADGATRLVVTAYIGIGNRLFIRGDGPGLSWEKGVPLMFVSIGKWRWETNDAAGTVRFRLYKNDEVECPGLGERSVEPGAQQELTAPF